jgi:hypothetical protein
MAGVETPVVEDMPAGVVEWQPPPGVIEELSALMDEGSRS